jgi:PhzF family phenazine biosynthesis protein
MSRSRAFKQVDVFTSVALKGNPVAVVLEAEGLSDAEMQAIANWTNLSETTFVTPASEAGADYAVRIFTPRAELPFAGHPTLGTAHAVLEAGLANFTDGRIVQQCGVGLVEVSKVGEGLSFRVPRYSLSDAPESAKLAAALGEGAIAGTPQIVDVGPRWVIVQLASAQVLENLAPDLATLAAYDGLHSTTGLTVYADDGAGGILVRSFAPADGIIISPAKAARSGVMVSFARASTAQTSISAVIA